jgi:hypothetical protein
MLHVRSNKTSEILTKAGCHALNRWVRRTAAHGVWHVDVSGTVRLDTYSDMPGFRKSAPAKSCTYSAYYIFRGNKSKKRMIMRAMTVSLGTMTVSSTRKIENWMRGITWDRCVTLPTVGAVRIYGLKLSDRTLCRLHTDGLLHLGRRVIQQMRNTS